MVGGKIFCMRLMSLAPAPLLSSSQSSYDSILSSYPNISNHAIKSLCLFISSLKVKSIHFSFPIHCHHFLFVYTWQWLIQGTIEQLIVIISGKYECGTF